MVDYNEIADRIFDQLKGFGHTIIIFDKGGRQTADAKKGRSFYSKDQKFTVELKDSSEEDNKNKNVIKIKYGAGTDLDKIKKLIATIRNGIAKKYLLGVDVMPYTGKDIELKDVDNMVKEGLSPTMGSTKTSYQQTEGAKLIIRHNKPVNEEVRGSRSRNISALFIENAQGERFKYPYNHLLAARTMTQHVAEGGTPYDELGQKIISLSEERNQLIQVSSYIKSHGLQEQAGDVHSAVTYRLSEIKNLLGKYNPERITGDIHEADESNLEELKERLTKNIFDESIDGILPKLNGYIKEFKQQNAYKEQFEALKQQVEESETIRVSSLPDLDLMSMVVYESPTINTTELINMVLPVLEDQEIKNGLEQVSNSVREGKIDAMEAENLTRSIIGKCEVARPRLADYMERQVFESIAKKYSIEQILK